MVKIKTHLVLLHTPLDILKPDIATRTDLLTMKDQQEKNN